MPELRFAVRWPDGSLDDCYSPSTVIKEYLQAGQPYALPEFLARSRTALELASERVRAKYGFACSSALDQLAHIEHKARVFEADADARVLVEGFSGA